MAEEIKKVISIDTKGGQSVKDLIAQVEKLKDLLKTLDSTSDEYKSTLDELKTAQDSLSSSIKSNKTEVEAAEGSYNALSRQMRDLKKEWKATNDEAQRQELGKEIKGINDQLKALDQSIGNNQRNVGNYAGSFQALKQEIKDARDVMVSAARGSDEYAEAAARAAEASNKLRDMQQEIALGSSGLDNRFAVMSKTLAGVSGGFAAVQGAMALFGKENENLQKTFVKLQAAMSMTQGFKALAELPKALNAAKIAFGNVTKSVNMFKTSLTGVKGAIAATGIGLLVVLLGELIANWDSVTEAVGNFVGGMDHLSEVVAGVGNVIKNFVTGPMKALDLALKGHFKEAGEAIKQTFDIATNYEQGAAKKASENAQKRLKEKAAETAEELDYQIRMNEAKEGSDWKYTEKAREMYEKYFKNMLAQYDENSKEYKEMLIKMESYNREFTEHQKAEEDKRNQANQAAYNRAKALAEQQKKIYDDAAAAAGDAIITEMEKKRNELEAKVKEFEPLITKAFGNPPFKELGESLVKEANKTITEQKNTITQALNKVGLTYEGMMDVLKNGPKEAIAIYDDVLLRSGLDLTKELYTIFDKGNAVMLNLTKSHWREMGDIIDHYSTLADESIRKHIINEGRWELFIAAVKNVINDALDEENKNIFELANAYNMTFDEIQNMHEVWASGYSVVLGRVRDENWKFTEEGKKHYDEYYSGLMDYYKDDFENWMKVLDEKSKYEQDRMKYLDGQTKKALKERLAYELAEIDAYNAELEQKADQGYWSFAYGEGTWHEVGKFFGFIMEDSLKLYDEEIEINNQYLENFKRGIEAQMEEIQAEMELSTTTAEEKARLEIELAELKKQLAEETYKVFAQNEDKQLEKAKKIEKMKKSLVSSTADLAGNVSDLLNEYAQNNVDTNKHAAEQSFEWSKALAYGETWISTLATVQNIIKSFSGMGPWGVAAGAVAGAAALASGIARTVQIANQKLGDTGNMSSSVSTVSATAVPEVEAQPFTYTSTVTNAEDEAKLNQPIIVQVSDIEDASRIREGRTVETSF